MHVKVDTPRGVARVRVNRKQMWIWMTGDDFESKVLDFCAKKINSFTHDQLPVEKIVDLPKKPIVDFKRLQRQGLI